MSDTQEVLKVSDIVVTLGPHKGEQWNETLERFVEVTLPQDVVFINGKWSGYVAHKPGAHISLLASDLPADYIAEVQRQVDELRGSASSKIVQVRTVDQNQVELVPDQAVVAPSSDDQVI